MTEAEQKAGSMTQVAPVLITAHTIVGTIAVIAGIAALIAPKGFKWHRALGKVFALMILTLGGIVALSSVLVPGMINGIGRVFAGLTSYFVVTAWITARTPVHQTTAFDRFAPIIPLLLGLIAAYAGWERFTDPTGPDADIPLEGFIGLAVISLITTVTDVRHSWRKGTTPMLRIPRHLLRMGLTLYFATASMFTGPGVQLYPQVVQDSGLLIVPELIVVGFTLFWLVRVLMRARRKG